MSLIITCEVMSNSNIILHNDLLFYSYFSYTYCQDSMILLPIIFLFSQQKLILYTELFYLF